MKSLKQLKESKIFNNKVLEHEVLLELFTLDEASGDSSEVLDALRNNEFTDSAKEFKKSLDKSKHQEMLTDYSIGELKKMKLFKLKDYNIGFALKKKDGKFNEIVAVHNNEPNVKGIGNDLMKSAIANGGEYLDHFDGFLTKFYQKLGFEEIARDKFDPQYDEDGSFRAKYGEADIIYRKLKK